MKNKRAFRSNEEAFAAAAAALKKFWLTADTEKKEVRTANETIRAEFVFGEKPHQNGRKFFKYCAAAEGAGVFLSAIFRRGVRSRPHCPRERSERTSRRSHPRADGAYFRGYGRAYAGTRAVRLQKYRFRHDAARYFAGRRGLPCRDRQTGARREKMRENGFGFSITITISSSGK